MTRTRQTDDYTPGGITFRFGQYDPGHPEHTYVKVTTDEVAPGDNQSFHMYLRYWEGLKLNAPYQGWAAVNWIDKLADGWRYMGTNFGHLSVSGVPSVNDLALTAVARTNPSRPYVDVPVEALQLGDTIRDLKSIGDWFFHGAGSDRSSRGYNLGRQIQAIGGANLSLQFNWLPLAEDLSKLLDFADQVERRVKEIQRLRSRGLRRTIPLGHLGDFEALVGTTSWNPQSFDYYIVTTYTARTRVKCGAHVRWKPTMDLSHLQPGDMRALARKAVLGLTFDGSSAWQLIPWTWLTDWCLNIGDWFRANRNIIPAQLESCSVLKHTRSEYISAPWSTPYGSVTMSLSEGRAIAEDKERIPASPIPIAHFPFLSGNQLGILGSLAVTGKSVR